MALPLKINHLDHVAILASDMERSAKWYEQVLGLTRISPPEWGGVPIMMFAVQTGVAIFPQHEQPGPEQKRSVDHFAFNIDKGDMGAARDHLNSMGVAHQFKDHLYYHSIYFKDPDGHTVELTAQVRKINL